MYAFIRVGATGPATHAFEQAVNLGGGGEKFKKADFLIVDFLFVNEN